MKRRFIISTPRTLRSFQNTLFMKITRVWNNVPYSTPKEHLSFRRNIHHPQFFPHRVRPLRTRGILNIFSGNFVSILYFEHTITIPDSNPFIIDHGTTQGDLQDTVSINGIEGLLHNILFPASPLSINMVVDVSIGGQKIRRGYNLPCAVST